jgi:hypothetical protein
MLYISILRKKTKEVGRFCCTSGHRNILNISDLQTKAEGFCSLPNVNFIPTEGLLCFALNGATNYCKKPKNLYILTGRLKRIVESHLDGCLKCLIRVNRPTPSPFSPVIKVDGSDRSEFPGL